MRSFLALQRVWLYRHSILKLYDANLLRGALPPQPYCKGFQSFFSIYWGVGIRVKKAFLLSLWQPLRGCPCELIYRAR